MMPQKTTMAGPLQVFLSNLSALSTGTSLIALPTITFSQKIDHIFKKTKQLARDFVIQPKAKAAEESKDQGRQASQAMKYTYKEEFNLSLLDPSVSPISLYKLSIQIGQSYIDKKLQ